MATPAVQDPETDEVPYSDPMSGAILPSPQVEEEKGTAKKFFKGEAPPSKDREEMLKRPYVAPTGGEPTPTKIEIPGQTTRYPGGITESPDQELPYEVPSWTEIQATDEYKQADNDTRLRMLDSWNEDAHQEARIAAIRQGEDPSVYEKGLQNLYSQQRKTLENPFSIYANTYRTFGKAFAEKSLELIAAGAQVFASPVKLDDIKNMSIDEAKHELSDIDTRQAFLGPRADAARAYLKAPLATADDVQHARENLQSLQDQSQLYHNVPQQQLANAQKTLDDTLAAAQTPRFPGGGNEALSNIKISNDNQIRMDALKRYIDSGGKDLPKETDLQRSADLVKQFPEMAANAMKVDQVYAKEHPLLNNFVNQAGAIAPYLLAGVVTGGTSLGGVATQAIMGYADAFQTGYESAQEKLNERERQGEHFSPGEREVIAENDGAQNAFGTGTLMAASNILLGHAFSGMPLDAEKSLLAKDNLKRMLLTAGKDSAEQVALQTGSQVTSNLATAQSGAAPETPWHEGIPEAAETGLVYGGVGGAIRILSSIGARKGEQLRLGGLADRVQSSVDNLMQNPPVQNLTNAEAYEHVLNETVHPDDRDTVRKIIALRESAKDQTQVADELGKAGSPSTQAEMEKQAEATANTPVTATGSAADRIARLKEQIQRAREEQERQAAAELTAKKTEKRLTPPTAEEAAAEEAPPSAEKKAPTAAEVPTPQPEDQAAQAQRRQGILDKVDQLLGPEADPQAKKDLWIDYLNRNVYRDPNMEKLQKSAATQVIHDLGISEPMAKRPTKWDKHTPEMIRMMEDHFSDYLDDRLKQAEAERTAKEAPTPAVAAEPAVTAPVIPPPELMQDALTRDNPDKIVQQLQAGHEIKLTEDEATSTEADNFFLKHRDQVEAVPVEDGYVLKLAKAEAPEAELEQGLAQRDAARVKQYGVGLSEMRDLERLHHAYDQDHKYVPTREERKLLDKTKALPPEQRTELEKWFNEQVQGHPLKLIEDELTEKGRGTVKEHKEVIPGQFEIELSKNADDYAKETDALAPHPQEPELLRKAVAWLNSDKGTGFITGRLRAGLQPYLDEVKSAALEGYRRALRSEAGKAAKAEEPEAEPSEAELEKAEKETDEKKIPPSIYFHTRKAIAELVDKASAKKMVPEEQQIKLQAPAGGEGATETKEAKIASAEEAVPYYEQAEGLPPTGEEAAEAEILKAAPELSQQQEKDLAERQERARQYATGTAQIQDWAQQMTAALPEKDRRILWYVLTSKKYLGITDLEVPKEYKKFTGIEDDANTRRIRNFIDTWIKEHSGFTPARAEEVAHGLEPTDLPPGESGHHATSTVPPVHAAAHGESVLPKSEGKRSLHGEPPGEVSGREPGVPPGGETAVGQPPEVLQHLAGGEGGGEGGITISGEPAGGAGAAGEAAQAGAERGAGAERPRGPTAASRERTAIIQGKAHEERGGSNPTPGGGTSTPREPGTTTGLAAAGGESGLTVRYDEPNQSWYVQRNGEDVARFTSEQKARYFIAQEDAAARKTSRAVEEQPKEAKPGAAELKQITPATWSEWEIVSEPKGGRLMIRRDKAGKEWEFVRRAKGGMMVKPVEAVQPEASQVKPAEAAAPTLAEIIKTPYTPPERRAEIKEQILSKFSDARRKMYETRPDLIAAIDRQVEEQWSKEEDAAIRSQAAQAILPTSTAAKPGVEPAVPRLGEIARKLLDNPQVAEDHGIEDVTSPAEMMERLNEEAELSGDPDEYLKDVAKSLGMLEPAAGPAAAPEVKETPQTIQAGIQQKILDAYKQLAAETGKESVPNAEVIRRAGVNVNDGKNAIKALGDRVQLSPGDWSSAPRAHRDAAVLQGGGPKLYMRVEDQLSPREGGAAVVAAPAGQVENIAMASAHSDADKIVQHLIANPDVAERIGLNWVRNSDDLVEGFRSMFGADVTPEKINRAIAAIGQKLGVLDPPKPPGGTKSSGTMHSLAPGMSGVHHFSGQVSELVDRFRQATDPDMQAFAISLNGHRAAIIGMAVRELNAKSPAIFYHDGELWVSRSAVNHQLAEPALAHEIQHAIAQQKISAPRTAEDFQAAAHWEHLRDQLRQSLPAEVRDRLEALSDVFDQLDAGEELDTRYLTQQELNWLPTMYAAHTPEAMMHATFSNPVFRDYLKTVQMGDGRNLLQGVQHWSRTVFGSPGLRFADRAVPLVKDRPGMPVKFNAKVFDLRRAYPLTESEKNANLMAQRYQLRNGVHEALRAVMNLSTDSRHSEIAKALLAAVEAHPEIKIGLEDRLGGVAGGYDFHGDRVTVNPHLDHQAIESSILHEVVHALTLGKIDAYEKGLVHLLSPVDMQAINELEQIRRQALTARGVPQIVRDIAEMSTYQQREKAWLNLGQKDPALANKFYGLGDTREFASEVMSNGGLQDFLNRLPYQGEAGERPRTMLQKLFHWVRKFLGFREDTAMAHAFESVASLSGGRRVMESDIQTSGLVSGRTMPMQENLLAKRYLENKAQAEGYTEGARQAPPEQINAWLREFREQRGLASGSDPYKPETIAAPETRAQFKMTPELSRLTDPRDLIDYLARVSGNSRFDADTLREVTERAFKDRALSVEQYIAAHAGLNELDNHTFNKLNFSIFGAKEDNESLVSRFLNAIESFRPGGIMAKTEAGREIFETALKHQTYERQAAALEIRNRREALAKAVRQEYKGGNPTPKQTGDMNRVLKGEAAPPTMPTSIVSALQDMRAHIDSLSARVATYVGKDKAAQIVDNLGKYVARTYRFFDDPRYDFREASRQHLTAAETAVNAWLKGGERAKEARRVALNAAEDAERKFGIGSTAGKAAYWATKKKVYADTMKNIGPVWVKRKLAELNQARENKATNFLQYGHAYNIDENLLKRLSNLPLEFRQLLGEETDPGAIFAKTAWRQEAYINSVQLSKGLLDIGRRTGIFSDRLTDTNTFQVPTLFAHMGELAGKYTTRDVAKTLTNWAQNISQLDEGPIMGLIRGLEGKARWFATIGNLTRSFGNYPMALFQHLNNGYTPWTNKKVLDAWWSQLSRMNTKAQEAYMLDAYRHGLSDKEADINTVLNFLKNGPHITDARNHLDIIDAMHNWYERAKQYPIGGKISAARALEFATDLHTSGNFASKMSQWEQQKLKERAFNDWDVKNRGARRFTEEEIKDLAARVVRDTNVSYSLAPPMIQKMRRTPVIGTFLTFAEEAQRSYVMSGFHALKNIRSDNPLRKVDGYRRLAGMMTSFAIPLLLQKATQQMFGVTDKEDENFRKMLAPWEQNNAIIYGPKDGNKRTYMNALYSSAQSDLYRGMHALLNFNNPHGIVGQLQDAGYELFRPAMSLGLFPGAGVDILRNQTEYGTQVYNPEDHLLNQMGDVGKYLFTREVGGSIGHLISRIIPGVKPEGTVSPSGAVYNMFTALAPEIGFNVKEMSFPERFNSELYSSKDSIAHAERIFSGPIQRSGRELTDDEMSGLYQRSEDARRIVFHELHQKVEAARFGGMNTQQIRTALKIRHYSSQVIDDLLSGRYHPYIPSSGILKNARSNGNLVPNRLFSKHGVLTEEETEE